jgi:surface-adhesin protein E
MTINPPLIAAFFIISAVLTSCAGKEPDESLDPVVAKEASIPVAAAQYAHEPSTEPSRDLPILKKDKPRGTTAVNKESKGYRDTWFLVAEVKGEKVYAVYVDTSSIENAEDGIGSWSKLVFPDVQRDDDGLSYNEVQISSSIDCAGKTYAYNTSRFYNSIGQLVYQEDITYKRNKITPDTLSAYVADFVCGSVYEDKGE